MLNDTRLPERFWSKIAVDPETGCWTWLAHRDEDGYGHYRLGDAHSKKWRTHRLTYSVFVGPLLAGMEIDHACRNRACCNPAHLEQVEQRENIDRGENYIARNRAKTHCPQGHPYVGENLVLKTLRDGVIRRICRTCRNDQARKAMRQRRTGAAA